MKTRHRAAIAVALGATIAAGSPSIAHAAQGGDIAPRKEGNFATWFWGRTQVCVKNVDATHDGSFTWVSSTSNGFGPLEPQQETCFTRSFAGFRISITNASPAATLRVRLPIGP